MSNTGSIRKNSRPSLVCTNCRRRKVKCDRIHPCTRCIKSKISESCFYDTSANFSRVGDQVNDFENQINPTESIFYDNNKSILSPVFSSSISSSSYSRMNSPVFNFQTMEYKRPLFVKNNGLVTYKSPLTLEAITNNNKTFNKIENMLSYLFASKEIDEYSSKLKNESNFELRILYGIYSKEEIDTLIIQYILPNFNAINERLNYFENELKDKALWVFIPSKIFIEKFNKTFSKAFTVDDNGEIIYNKINLKSDYAFFTAIFSIMRLVSIMLQHDPALQFQYELTLDAEKITEIFLKFMSFCDYKNTPSFDLLLGFLIYRIAFFLSDSISHNSNSDLFFEAAINICYKLGMHLNCNQIDGYNEEIVRGVWNIVQFVDAISAVYTGGLLKIDYRYCIPRFHEYIEPLIIYFRQFVSLFTSISPISLNQIIELAENACKLFSIFKPFDELLNDTPNGSNQYMFFIMLKSDFLVCYQLLLFIIRLSLDNLDTILLEANEYDLRLINEYKNKTEVQLFHASVLTFEFIRKVSNGKISKFLQSAKLTIVLRLFFSRFLAINNKVIFAHLSVFNKHQLKKSDKSKIFANNLNDNKKFSDITLAEAEKYLAKGIDDIEETDAGYQNMKELMGSIPKLSEYLMDIYFSTSGNTILIDTGRFNIHFKFLLFICILLQNAHELYELKSYEDKNYQFQSEDWKQVIDKTTDYITNVENKGYGISDQLESDVNMFVSDWDFLESTQLRDTLGYRENGENGEIPNVEFEEMYQMFFG